MNRLRTALLWMLVIDLGIAFGAGIYESRVVIPSWADLPPSRWPNTGLMFWAFVTTVPLTLITLAGAVAAWRDRRPRRSWWIGAVAIVLLERLATFGYFIPTMLRLTGTDFPPSEVQATLAEWQLLNHGRHLLTLLAWLGALKALSLSGGANAREVS